MKTTICASSATFLKKTLGILSEPPDQRFQRINAMKTEHPIRSLCAALEVSASGYYDWFNRQDQPGPRAQENARLVQKIVQIHQGQPPDLWQPAHSKVAVTSFHERGIPKGVESAHGEILKFGKQHFVNRRKIEARLARHPGAKFL